MRQAWIGALAGALGIAACPGAIVAQPETPRIEFPGPGRIMATSYMKIPVGLPVAVRPLDDSTNNLRLKTNIEAALAARRWQLQGATAPLAFNFEVEYQALGTRVPGVIRQVRPNPIVEPESQVERIARPEDTVLLGRSPDGRGGVRYVLTATIDDQRSGQRLWHGEASYDGVASDEQAVLRAMVPLLVNQIGQTVRRQPFRFD